MSNQKRGTLFDQHNELPVALAMGIAVAVFGIALLLSADTRTGGIFFTGLGALTVIVTTAYSKWKHYPINWSKFWMVVVLIIIGPGFIVSGASIMTHTTIPMTGYLGWLQATCGMLISSLTLILQKKNPILMVFGFFLFIIGIIMLILLGNIVP